MNIFDQVPERWRVLAANALRKLSDRLDALEPSTLLYRADHLHARLTCGLDRAAGIVLGCGCTVEDPEDCASHSAREYYVTHSAGEYCECRCHGPLPVDTSPSATWQPHGRGATAFPNERIAP